jgi:hypothetical protein
VSKLRRISLAVRKRLPRGVRQVLRLGRHIVSRPQPSAPLPTHLLAECRVCASREDLIGLLPRGGRIAEIGTQRGDFARHILATAAPAELHLIDLDFSSLAADVAADRRVVRHDGNSHLILQQFPDAHFDWIYVDADHSFAGVKRDAAAAAAKVKPGGYLVFNDFAHVDTELGAYGVHRAVVEFANERQWPFCWLAYQPNALYDVALRRPPD